MVNHFAPKPGRFGTIPNTLYGKQLDAGITASATVNIPIGTGFRKQVIFRAGVSYETAPVGGAAITGILWKKPVGLAAIAITTAFTLTALALQQVAAIGGTLAVPLVAGLTDPQLTINEGDYLYFAVTAAGTVTTQPVGLVVTVETLIRE